MKVNRKTLPLKLKHEEVQQSSIDNTINNKNIFHHYKNSRNLEFPSISENLTNTQNSNNHNNNKKQKLIRFNSITSLSNVMKIKRKSTYNTVHTNNSNYFKTNNVSRNKDGANDYLDTKPPNIRIRKESNFDILLNPNNINSYNSREDHFNKNSIKKENLKALLIKNKLNKHRSSGNLIIIKNDHNILNDRVSISKAKRNTNNTNIINKNIRDSKSKSNPFLICLENINNYKEIKYKFYNDMLDKYKKENNKYVRNNKVSFKHSINNDDDDDYMDIKLNRDRFHSTNEFTKIDDNLIIDDYVVDKNNTNSNNNIKYKYNLNNKLKLKQCSKDQIESLKIKNENIKNNQKSSLKVHLKKKKYVLAMNSSKNNLVNSNNNNDMRYPQSRKSYPLFIHNKHSSTSNLNHLNLNTEFYSCGLSSNNKDSIKLSKFKSEKQLLNYVSNNPHKNNNNNVNNANVNGNGNFKYKFIKKDNKKVLLNSNVEKNDNNLSSIDNSHHVSRFSIKDINNNQNKSNILSISPEYDDDNVNYNAENSDEDDIINNNSKVEIHSSQRIIKTHNNKKNNSNIDKSKNNDDASHLNTNKNKEPLILINTNNNSNILDKNKKKKRVNFLCCFGI